MKQLNELIFGAAVATSLAVFSPVFAEAKEPIILYDGGWENIQVNNAIAEFLIEAVFGHPVDVLPSNVPGMQEMMVTNEIDINMEMWRSLMNPWVTSQLDNGNIVDLGVTYESASQGFYVPTYVIKGDPSRGIQPIAPRLKTVAELAQLAPKFSSSQAKPGWINCIPGWACREPNRVKMVTYGVGAVFDPIETSSEAELNGLIFRSYQLGEPFVTYYWDPSPLLGQLDMTLLQEPAYTDECWEKIEAAVADYKPGNASEEACAYETVPISKFATDDFVSEYPDVAAMLGRMLVGTDTVRELVAYMTSKKVSPEETAVFFLKNHTKIWSAWLSTDQQVQKVQAALRDAK